MALIRLTGGFYILYHRRVGCKTDHGFTKCMGRRIHVLKINESKESNTLEGGSAEGEEEQEFSLLDPQVASARIEAINSPEMKDLLKTIGCIEDADIEEGATAFKSKEVHPPQWPPKKRTTAFSVDQRADENIFHGSPITESDVTTTTIPPSLLSKKNGGKSKTGPVLSQLNSQDDPPRKE